MAKRENERERQHTCTGNDFFPCCAASFKDLCYMSVVPFFGSSSLAILLGGEANSSSLKGNLLMPELQWGDKHAHKSMLKRP